jgi:hypothetical protein
MASATGLLLSEHYQLSRAEKQTIPISRSVALELYSNTKPYNLKIGNLQKGLILVYDGVERIGEGTGFGFPVLICPKETYFSSSAEVWVKQTQGSVRIRKEFIMDRIARNKVANVQLENQQARAFIKVLTQLYQKNKRFRYLSLKELIERMGAKCTFVKISSVGKVPVTYTISDHQISVEVDLNKLSISPKKIFVLNEQSASFFPRYQDSNGANLFGKQMGAWDTVNAKWACLLSQQEQIGYRLWNVDDCVLRRGSETMKNCLDWAGLDYEVPPLKDVFEYQIEILGGKS